MKKQGSGQKWMYCVFVGHIKSGKKHKYANKVGIINKVSDMYDFRVT